MSSVNTACVVSDMFAAAALDSLADTAGVAALNLVVPVNLDNSADRVFSGDQANAEGLVVAPDQSDARGAVVGSVT